MLEEYIYNTYIKNYPNKENLYKNKPIFLQESYSKYFAKDILFKLLTTKDKPIEFMELYLDDMATYMTLGKAVRSDWIFAVGYDVASDILGFLYSRGEYNYEKEI